MNRLTKYIGQRVGDGIVVGARRVNLTEVEFDVLDGGVVTKHRIPTRRET